MPQDFRAMVAADAKKIIDMDGVSIGYTADGDTLETIKCFPRSNPLTEMDTDNQATLEITVWIGVSKMDVPVVVLNADTVAAPGEWSSQSGTVTYRVAQRLSDRSHPGFWLLGIK